MTKKIYHLPIIVFMIIAAIVLAVINNDLLYTIQDCSIFCKGHTFQAPFSCIPGGMISWIGCYFTQYFYYPWLGTSILIIMWMILYFLCIKVYKLTFQNYAYCIIPITALLCSLIGLGYWIYYMNMPGYWFSGTLGCIYLTLSILGYSKLQNNKIVIIPLLYIILISSIGYYLCGWWGLLASICCTLYNVKKEIKTTRFIISSITSIILLGAIPLITYYISGKLPIEKAWIIGFPLFKQNEYIDWKLSIPFFIIIIWFVIMTINKPEENKDSGNKKKQIFLSLFIATLFLISPFWLNYNDSRFKSEIRMYKLLDECRWKEIISEYSKNSQKPTNQMIICKNIALLHLGKLGAEGFQTGMIGTPPTKQGELKVSMAQTIAPLLYYHHGCINYASRSALNNIAQYGLSVRNLKILIRCAVINNEPELAQKYIAILNTTTYHRKWAAQWMQYTIEARCARESKEINTITPMIVLDDILDDDCNMCESFLLDYFATLIACTKEQQEMALCYAMLLKDDELIKYQIENYYSIFGENNIPIHVLEAVDVFNQEHSTDYLKFIQDYQNTIGTGKKIVEIGKQLNPIYGQTYWWYYYFVNKFDTY